MSVSKIGTVLVMTIAGFAVWLMLVGTVNPAELIIAACVSLLVGIAFAFFIPLPVKLLNPIRWFWLLVYVPYFLLQMIKANLQIASLVVQPSLPIKPALVKGRTTLKSDLGRLLLTSSITLTPGTLSVDIHDDEIEIHCVVAESDDAVAIMAPFEKYIRRITE